MVTRNYNPPVHLESHFSLISAPPQLGPLCTVDSCKECVCVNIGDHVTCSALTPDVQLKVDGKMLGQKLQYSNGTSYTYASEDVIDASYHGKTIECISKINVTYENISAISTIFVLGKYERHLSITFKALCKCDIIMNIN